jgi:hypothetical protein
MKTWAFELNNNNVFDLKIENKKGQLEDIEVSFSKHNFFCKGRVSKFVENNYSNRFGSIFSFIRNKQLYSTAYQFYENQNNAKENLEYIKKFFNVACSRDYKDGLFEKKIVMTDITSNNNEIICNIQIGEQQTMQLKYANNSKS